MSFFGFGAFSSPVGQLVERATDNAASAGNLALHLEICDAVNESDTGPKEAVTAIRKRLTGNTKNFHIINLTLTVLETCVKNCGLRFHSKIAQKDFLADLMKVVHPKNNPPTIVKERILGLIQYWADAFKGKPQLVAVEEMYEQMKREGVEFPPIDLDNLAPVETRGVVATQSSQPHQLQIAQPAQPTSRSPGTTRSSSSAPRQRGPMGPLAPEQIAKMLSEFDLVRKNMDIMSEILHENQPGSENQEDLQLLDELNRVLHEMQLRVSGLIERCQDEIILESTLLINDDLNTLFVRYDRWLSNSAAAKSTTTEATPTAAQGTVATTSLVTPGTATGATISYPNMDEPPPPAYETTPTDRPTEQGVGQLIDLGSEITAPVNPPGGDDIVSQLAQLGVTGQPATEAKPTDEFDIFAESRNAYANQGSTYDDNMVQQTTSISAAVHGRPHDPASQDPTPAAYSNLTDWLVQTDLQSSPGQTNGPSQSDPTSGPPESATSAEFDQFLAQRASSGDGLAPERPRPQMQKAEDQSDELFSL